MQAETSTRLTLMEMRQDLTSRLRGVGIETAALDARLLICAALNMSREDFLLHGERVLSQLDLDLIEPFARRRLEREPVSRILGYKEFWSLRFKVNEDVLDPRPDSETLIEAVLKMYPDRDEPLRILDLGTGTGCLLLTLLSEYKNATGVGVDLCDYAIEVAQENALDLDLSPRARFIDGNWYRPVTGSFDIIISNPPYIPSADIPELEPEVKDYDPLLALDGGDDGFKDYRIIVAGAADFLEPDGMIFIESGDGQADELQDLCRRHGALRIGNKADLTGTRRVVFAAFS